MTPPIRFEEFELDIESFELRRSGRAVKLERIPLQLLILLLQNPGKLVRRQTIEQELWGGHHLLETEHSINTAVNKLRVILRDDSRDPQFIRTVVGQGYRFIAEVKPGSFAEGSLVSPAAVGGGNGCRPDVPSEASNGAAPAASSAIETSLPVPPAWRSVSAPLHPADNMAGRGFIVGSLAGLAAVLAVALTIYFLRAAPKVPTRDIEPTQTFHSIAVLPFRNLAHDTDQDYLVDGMTDQLISNLAMSTPLRVISYRSVMEYKGVQLPLKDIAQALNVDAIVEGSYLRHGNEIRITAQLLDAQNDRHLWAEVYPESADDPLAMQDQVTKEIAREVALAAGSSFNLSMNRPVSEAARNAFLRGRYLWNQRTPASVAKSIDYYTDAIRADRNYADAYAALSVSYVTLTSYGNLNPADLLWKAQFAAERALALNGSLSAAHTALGGVKNDRDWDWSGAEEEYRRAIAINPSDSTAHHWYGLLLTRQRRGKEALAELQQALALDPLSLIIATDVAETYYYLRQPDEAMRRIDEVLALNPNFGQAHLVKASILEQQGKFDSAEMENELAARLFGDGLWIETEQAYLLSLQGKSGQALEIARKLEDTSTLRYVSGTHIAQIYCALHDPDAAMRWLDRGYERHDIVLDMLAIDPHLDGCRTDLRFQALLRRLKLPA